MSGETQNPNCWPPPRTADEWDTWYQEHVRPGEKALIDEGAKCTWQGSEHCCELDDHTECTDYSQQSFCESLGGVWDAAGGTCHDIGQLPVQ